MVCCRLIFLKVIFVLSPSIYQFRSINIINNDGYNFKRSFKINNSEIFKIDVSSRNDKVTC